MKRFLLVFVLAAAMLALFAAPASAFYAPQPNTAYITSFVPYTETVDGVKVTYTWVEWPGPSDPFNIIPRSDPIPHGYKVVVTREWFDTRLGATLIPAEYFNTMSISRSTGCPSFAITKGVCGVRYWSPAYRTGDPGLPPWTWARDWWVPLGKLPPGHYSGWVTQFAPHAVPSWADFGDDTATPPIPPHILPLLHPFMNQPVDLNWTQDISFTVAP